MYFRVPVIILRIHGFCLFKFNFLVSETGFTQIASKGVSREQFTLEAKVVIGALILNVAGNVDAAPNTINIKVVTMIL